LKTKKLKDGGFVYESMAPGEFFAQGDVIVTRVARIPESAKKTVTRDRGRIVLAYGEVTGHAHAIHEASVEVFEKDGIMYLRVGETPAALVHEEHATHVIPAGDYQVGRQYEYDPVAEGDVRVAD
jgi:hypothetical protein